MSIEVGNFGNLERGLGNTRPDLSVMQVEKKRVVPSPYWAFTWNNYPDNWKVTLETIFRCYQGVGWIMGQEVGESGTHHIQGYVEFKKKLRPLEMKDCPKEIHWEKRKGTKQQNLEYCSKDGKYESWGTCKYEVYRINIELRDWQIELRDIIRSEPDDRTVYWYWEEEGGAGKTTFQKWLYLNEEDVIVTSGKAADMKNGVLSWIEKNQRTPRTVLVNIPRCQDSHCVSWQGIEEIKDMFFYSPKYEGGMVCGKNPHLIIFSNEEAPEFKMSRNRWVVKRIQ